MHSFLVHLQWPTFPATLSRWSSPMWTYSSYPICPKLSKSSILGSKQCQKYCERPLIGIASLRALVPVSLPPSLQGSWVNLNNRVHMIKWHARITVECFRLDFPFNPIPLGWGSVWNGSGRAMSLQGAEESRRWKPICTYLLAIKYNRFVCSSLQHCSINLKEGFD